MKKYEWEGQPVWLDLREVVGIRVAEAGYSGELLGSEVSLRSGKVLWVSVGVDELAAEVRGAVSGGAVDGKVPFNIRLGGAAQCDGPKSWQTKTTACDLMAGGFSVVSTTNKGGWWAVANSVSLTVWEEEELLGWLLLRAGR